MKQNIVLDYDGFILQVKGEYSEAEQGVHTLPNGDPGYPGSPSEFYIESIELYYDSSCTNIFALLPEHSVEEIMNLCIAEIENSVDYGYDNFPF